LVHTGKEIILILFIDDTIICKENCKTFIKKKKKNSLELINEFNKLVGYKINVKIQFCFYALTMNIQKGK